jgi:flagellin
LQRSSSALNASFGRLSTGVRSVKGVDDAAALAIGESLSTQARTLTIAERSAQDAVSMVQTAEGALVSAANVPAVYGNEPAPRGVRGRTEGK